MPAAPAATPAPYEVLGVNIEGGADDASDNLARQISGLRPGQQVQLPWDPSFSEAVRGLYSRGNYSDAQVEVSQVVGQGVFLTVRVVEQPKLAGYTIEGLGQGDRDVLADQIPLLRGRAVRPADVERGRLAIETLLRGKGYRTPVVTFTQSPSADGRIDLVYTVERGGRQTVADVQFTGNEAFSERTLRRQLKGTPERRWWRFWKRATFNDDAFEADLATLTRFYNDRGYFGARVVRDTVSTRAEDGGLVVQIDIEEGPRYAVRHVVFEGNTLFTDAQLQQAIDVRRGDTYNKTRLERNLYYSPDNSDVSSLYKDRGYLRFDAAEQVTVVGDSLDIAYEITEGEVYEFGDVRIAGNTRTKEHVIRRELRTIPGQPFSRQAVERSVRELSTLNYFDPASIGGGPTLAVNDETQTVDLTYRLAEKSSDQLELSGGWGGSGTGLILTARVTFANFSVQNMLRGRGNPMPSGDGQQLALQVQTYGRIQQVYSLSFTEPWFRGRQTPAGFSVGYSNYNSRSGDTRVARGFGRLFYRQRLRFPDDYFQTGTDIGVQVYGIEGTTGASRVGGLPEGTSREITFAQSLTRNALDNPQLPTAGSNLGLTLTIAPPVPGFIQYAKADFKNAWYTPIGPRLSASVRTQFGYIGSLTGEDVQFQRYLIGGTPLEANQGQGGINGFGRDLIFMRGYPLEAIGPRENGNAVGGRILNKYQAEVQWLALQSPQLTFAPYLFLDAANTWDSFSDYDPSRLYRSAGIGARVFLPILGLVDLTYGRQIDAFDASQFGTSEDGLPKWDFQFTLGGGS